MTSEGGGRKRLYDDGAASSSKRSRLLPQDPYASEDEQDTAFMDKKICEFMAQRYSAIMGKDDLPEAKTPHLLIAIIHVYSIWSKNTDAYCITRKPDVAQLIAQNASLRPALKMAWKDGSFAQITSSVLFRKGPAGEGRSFEVQTQIDATEMAWKSTYIGPYADLLKDTVVKEKATANFLKVTQSSGFGKSRTVYEVGRKLFSVYINLREEAGTGYPSRDPALCNFILRARYDRDELDRRSHCAAFLRGILTAATSVLGTDNPTPEIFRERLDVQRLSFDFEAAESAERYLSADLPMQDLAHDESLSFAKYQTHRDELVNAIQSFAEAAKIAQHDNIVLLAIDEYHTLDKTTHPDRQSTYHTLCSVLRDLRDCTTHYLPFFVIFLSTFSPSAPPPAATLHSSARVGSLRRVQLDPYAAFPFDIKTPVITENERTLDDVCTLAFISSFGRPLWMTRYKCGSGDVRRSLVLFAQVKLCGSEDLENVKDDGMFAALSTRLSLDFMLDGTVEYKAAREFEQRQVAYHMRTVHSISSSHGMLTGTPSEPILAEAAAHLLPDGSEQIRLLAQEFSPLIDKGKRGELVARLLCNLAHDTVIAALPQSPRLWTEELRFTKPIALIDFVKALVAPQWHNLILNSRPQGGGAPFREAFADSYVNFTHWAKMGDTGCLSTSALWKAAARGIAWQCCAGMEGISQIIPIVRGKDVKLGRQHVSALVIRDWNVRTPALPPLTRKAGTILFSDAPDGAVKPYIVLTMQLGGRSASRATQASSSTTPSTRKSLQYDVTVHGCSSTVYSVVNDKDRSHWGRILSTRNSLEEEHPRGDDTRQLELLRRSKPFFGRDKASFDWARNKDDGYFDEEQILEDIVTVGSELEM